MSVLRIHDDSAKEHHTAHECVTPRSQGQVCRLLRARPRTQDCRKHHLRMCVCVTSQQITRCTQVLTCSLFSAANDTASSGQGDSDEGSTQKALTSSSPVISYSKKSQLGISKKKRYSFDESVCPLSFSLSTSFQDWS